MPRDTSSPEYKAKRREIARKNRNLHYDKVFARHAAKSIPKKPCEVCEKQGVINWEAEAHHDDYKKPYSVRWLCKTHHEEWHTKVAWQR